MALFEVAIKDEIEAQGFVDGAGATPTYFLGLEEATPDFAVTVLPESGLAPQNVVGEFPGFSVRVRHPSGQQALVFLRRVFQHLQEFQGQPSGVPVARIMATAGPVHLGRDSDDAQGRWIVQQSFAAVLQQIDQLA